MTVISIIVLYLLGCVLTYGRSLAQMYEIEELMINTLKKYGLNDINSDDDIFSMKYDYLFSIYSWIGFLAVVIMYFSGKEKYFFKWSRKQLFK